jgi:dGTPase
MDPTRAFVDSVLKYKSLWSERKYLEKDVPEHHFLYDFQQGSLDWVLGGADFPVELGPGDERDAFKSIECQIMDWADDTAYSLNDLSDSVRAGFLTLERIERWAERRGEATEPDSALGELMQAMRRGRVDPFVGKRIGRYIRAASLVSDTNFMSGTSQRYRFRLAVDPEVRAESKLFKQLAFEVVFLSPQLKQLEHKGSHMLRRLWELLETRYVRGERIDGQDFQLLPEDAAEEIEAAASEMVRARLVCDFLAGMSDGYAARMYQRLFVPDFGSIGDLVG